MKSRLKGFFVLSLIVVMILLSACSSNASAGNVSKSSRDVNEVAVKELKLISFLAVDHQLTKDLVPLWIKKVEEGTGGALKIKWIGGPESMPSTDQFNGVKNGIVDINFNVSSMYANLMPEAHSLLVSPYSPSEERENGYFDYMSERFKDKGIVYLGRWLGEQPFYFWSNKEIEKLDDLNNVRFRSNSIYHGMMSNLGIVQIDVGPSDVYTSLQRKLVDGFGFTLIGPRESGWTEVTKYIIDEGFLNQNATVLMNPKTFNGLSEELQQQLIAITAEFEKEMIAYFIEKNTQEWEGLKEAGVQIISLSQEDRDRLQIIVKEETWKTLGENVKEPVITELKEYLYN